ncbi:hypothetical protein Trydic_g21102 [Trypoxylus dichotomus]
MSSNDPRRNNLLFRPNNSVDDEQPTFLFYSQPEPLQSTSTTLANISGLNTSQNPRGLNTAPYQFSNVNQTNTWRQTNLSPTPSSLRQSITPPKQPHTVPVPSAPPLYPPGGLPHKPTVPEPVPSVILFSNAGNPSKPLGPESALTISTYSSGITSSKPTTSEIQSVPLFPSSVFTPQTSIQQSVSLFTPGNISQISSFTSKHISQTPAQGPSQNYIQQSVPLLHDSKPLVSCFPPQTISPKPVASVSEQIPLFPVSALPAQPLTSNSGSSIPFFASRGPSTGAVGVESTLFTDSAPIESAPPIPLFSPADLASKAAPGQAPATGSTNTYRRVGSKRAVYAPIPGLLAQTTTNTSQLPVQHSSLADYFSSSSTVLTPQHIAPKHINQSDSSQANSPFLSPVTEPPILPSGDNFSSGQISSSVMPEMAANDGQIASGSMYSNDGKLSTAGTSSNTTYIPPRYHWFYKKELEPRAIWEPFSMYDSASLEKNFTSPDLTPEKNIPTEGGRFDVNILRRQKTSVYWDSKPSEVRRCSWFYKSHTESKYVPFEENIATQLEEEYKQAMESNTWHRKVQLPSGDSVMFHTPDVLVLFSANQFAAAIDNMQENQFKQKVVKRGIDTQLIDEGEPEQIDHLLFMVHGIGSGCDLKFRPVEEVVDDFRSVALQLVRTHYRSSCERKVVHRVEILPVGWHSKLHSEDTGIDNKLKSITLDSIPKLREFTNDTLLDILFYTSPFYGQTIISTVGTELNRIYDLFKQRNPDFNGGISLAGHSLGSLILFDILCNQADASKDIDTIPDEDDENSIKQNKPHPMSRRMSRRISYMVGSRGTGQAQIHYPILNFQPNIFFALGSPIGMFVTIRGLDNLGEQFSLPTCPGFFNIFHPYDPVAYRIESLINPQLANVKPVLIPHHKGRKRMHLELKETMAKVGSDLKQKLMDSMKNTWNSLLGWSNTKPSMQPAISEEVDKVLEQFASKHSNQQENDDQASSEAAGMNLGLLNKGRRVDYVLQEAPVEFFNEYIFALTSHVCYWESEDTVLLVIKEIYNLVNVSPDSQIPQQTMTIERPVSSRTPDFSSQANRMGVDPTMAGKKDTNVGPPPLSGFVKNS